MGNGWARCWGAEPRQVKDHRGCAGEAQGRVLQALEEGAELSSSSLGAARTRLDLGEQRPPLRGSAGQ